VRGIKNEYLLKEFPFCSPLLSAEVCFSMSERRPIVNLRQFGNQKIIQHGQRVGDQKIDHPAGA